MAHINKTFQPVLFPFRTFLHVLRSIGSCNGRRDHNKSKHHPSQKYSLPTLTKAMLAANDCLGFWCDGRGIHMEIDAMVASKNQ